MSTQPMTLQLRYLQTLADIGVEKNTTIVFPLPMELMNLLNRTFNGSGGTLTNPVPPPPQTDGSASGNDRMGRQESSAGEF